MTVFFTTKRELSRGRETRTEYCSFIQKSDHKPQRREEEEEGELREDGKKIQVKQHQLVDGAEWKKKRKKRGWRGKIATSLKSTK